MAGTGVKYDPTSSVVVTERRTPRAGGGVDITTIRTSTVRNRIQVVDEHGQKVKDSEGKDVTYEQDFAMTSDPLAPMMRFTTGQDAGKKEIASIIKTVEGGADKYYLEISEEVLASLPEEVKDDIMIIGGQAMLALEPIEVDGRTIPPVEIDASTGEMKVRVQGKDGSKSYTCNFSATGVRVEYDGNTSDYKPTDAEGHRQIIDVEMSTAAFEDMVKTHQGIFKLRQDKELPADQELLNMTQIPYFLIGTYMEAAKDITEEVDNGDGTRSVKEKDSGTWSSSITVPDGKGGSQNMELLVVRLPDPENSGEPRDYYFAKDSRGKLYTIDDGKMRPITKGREGDSEHYYRCYPNAAGKITRAEFVMKVGPYYRKIGLAIGSDNRNLDPAVAAIINELEAFFPSEPLSRQTDSKHESVSGREYDAGDSTEIKKLDPTVKGYTIEEEEEKKQDPPPPPPPPKPKRPEFDKKEIKPPKFTQVPGQAAMIGGLFLILASVLLGPIGMAIMCSLGAALFVGGGLYCANVAKFNNPYDHVTRYIIKPYKAKDLETEQGVEAVYEQDQTRAKADAEYISAMEKIAESDFMQVFEAFGGDKETMAAQFFGEDNLEKREDFLNAMEQYLNTTFDDTPEGRAKADEARTRIIQTYFRGPHDPMFEGAQLDELKAKLFSDTTQQQVSDVKSLTEAQRAKVDAREAETEAILNATDAQFNRMINNAARTQEHNSAFVASNADAIARRILAQNMSDEQMREFNASLPDDAAREAVAKAMERQQAAAVEANNFAEQQQADAQTVAAYGTYRETTTAVCEKAAAEAMGPDARPADYADYVAEGTAAEAVMQKVTAQALQAAQETYMADLEAEHIPADDAVAVAIGQVSSITHTTINTTTTERNDFLQRAGFFADSLDHPRGGTMSQQIQAAVREEAIRVYREINPVAARTVTDATPTADILAKIPASKRSPKLTNLVDASSKQEQIEGAAVATPLAAVTSELRNLPLRIPVSSWDAQRTVTESLLTDEERTMLDGMTDDQKRETLDFVAAARATGSAKPVSELIDMVKTGAVERLAQSSARAGDISEATRNATASDVQTSSAQIAARQSQEEMLRGLTEEQRQAVKARVQEKVAAGATENYATMQASIVEVLGVQTLPDGRTYDALHRDGVTAEQVQHNFTQDAGYRRTALSRRLGAAQVTRIEEDHMDTTANEEAAAYVRTRDLNEAKTQHYENYCETMTRISQQSSAIAAADRTKAPADRVGQGILTIDDIRDKTSAYLHAVSAAKTRELLAGLALPAGDPLLTAIQHQVQNNDAAATGAKKLKNLLSKRDRILDDPDIDLFNQANDEITAAHGLNAGAELPATTIEARLEAALRDELIVYLGSKGVADLLTMSTTQLLAELNKPAIGGAPAGTRLAKLIAAQKLQDEIDGKGITTTSQLDSLTTQMETDGGTAPIPPELQTQIDAIVDADTAITAGMTDPAEIATKRASVKKLIARYIQNGGHLTPQQVLDNLSNGTYGTATRLARQERAQEGAPAEADARNGLKDSLNKYDDQFKEVLAALTPAQRKEVKAKKPRTWHELKTAVSEVLGKKTLPDGTTFEDAHLAGTTSSSVREANVKLDSKARAKLERRIGKEAARKLIERIERREQEDAARKVQEDEAERQLAEQLHELEEEIKAAEAITDKKEQERAFKRIREKCKEDRFQSLFKKKKPRTIAKVKESIARRLRQHKEKVAQEKREGLTMKQIEDRTSRYGKEKDRADEAAMGAPTHEAVTEDEAARGVTHEADGGEADAS